ncbi:hypothetical protein T07_2569 [Trichinella nelsoni]|uniref:Uncharacterized protein n=1 Tax=Trichinella nelsoni TaxID=6336 RepID=A0A0V0RP27_9BILA|nr:hypothetical protein T07_2569 [Trichinella nelsoni]
MVNGCLMQVPVMAVLMWYMCVCNIYKKQKQYREDMQEYDYICAPPLMATNKLTDHESDILQYCMIVIWENNIILDE